MRITGTSGGRHEKPTVTIEFENKEEFEAFERAYTGCAWIRMNMGSMETCPAFETYPEAKPNPELPFFGDGAFDFHYIDTVFRKELRNNPSFFVQGLAPYGSGSYDKAAKQLTEAGFELLRSKRGRDGKRWEVWYLPGEWSAKGPIEGKKTRQILSWLMNSVRPGGISLEGEYWGMGLD